MVIDNKHLIQKILPDFKDTSSYCLRYVDLYGDTTFNRMQMDQLKKEFELIKRKTRDKEIKLFIEKIMVLIGKCKRNVHTYIKFLGD